MLGLILHVLFGVLAAAAYFGVMDYARNHEISIVLWQKALIVLELLFCVFALEVTYGFLAEAEPQAALVTGGALLLTAVVGAVLLQRFILKPAKKSI